MDLASETERVRRHYDKRAAAYDRLIVVAEKLLFAEGRRWLCAGAEGSVLEIGIGTGRNLPYYPRGVRLTGVDLSTGTLEIARRRARELGVEAELRAGDAQALDFPDGAFDTVVSALTMCTIPHEGRAVAEAMRVLRPGGAFRLLEHVRSPVAAVRGVQRLLDPLFVRFEADHLLREPVPHLEAAGFEIEQVEVSRLGIVEWIAARKPTTEPVG